MLLSVNEGTQQIMAGAKGLGPDIEAKVRGYQVLPTTDENWAHRLEELQSVRKATPVIMWEPPWEGRGLMIPIGMIPSDAQEIYADVEIVEGRHLEDTDNYAIELGYRTAKLYGLSVGDSLPYVNENFEVVGIIEETGSILDVIAVMPLWSLQSQLGYAGKASAIWVWIEDKTRVEEVIGSIEESYPELEATEGMAVLEYSEEFIKFGDAIRLIVLTIAVLIGTLAAMNTVTMSTFERTREFGTMRSLGASGGYIFKLVLVESVFLCVIGGLLGCLLGYLASMVMEHVILNMIGMDVIAVTLKVLAISVIIAVGVGLIAGLYPARRVSRQEIVEALRYE